MTRTTIPEPIGTRFGKWTVRDHTVTNRHRMRQAVVECDCGTFAVIIMANLRTGKSTRCRRCASETIVNPHRLTHDQVAEIKHRLVTTTDRLADIAEDYDVSRGAIYDIACDRNWHSVPWPNGRKPMKRDRGLVLSYDRVQEIKRLIKAGKKLGDIAVQFDVAYNTIWCIKSGYSWRDCHVE